MKKKPKPKAKAVGARKNKPKPAPEPTAKPRRGIIPNKPMNEVEVHAPELEPEPPPTPNLLPAPANSGQLPDALTRPAILRDFAQEQPHPSTWPDWIDSKAYVYGVDRVKVEKWLVKHMEGFDEVVQSASWQQAQVVAKALGATRASVINTAAQMLVATRPIPVKVKKGEEDKITIPAAEVPDWEVRKFAVGFFERMYGMAMPAKVEHQVDIGDNLMAVSEAELRVRLAELQAKVGGPELPKLGQEQGRAQAQVIEGAVEVVTGG